MPSQAVALVQIAPHRQEFQEIPLPVLDEGAGLLRVEANGICGTDAESIDGTVSAVPADGGSPYPRINGHEIVGIVEDLGPNPRPGLKIGDRVAVNPFLPCGKCRACLRGENQMCRSHPLAPAVYGFIPTRHAPGLWGGYSTHIYLDPDVLLYPMPATLDPLTATLWNPLAGAIGWSVLAPGTRLGDTVAILGTGQRGLACVAAVKLAGASMVLATGLTRDRHKLDLALDFGADTVVDVEQEDLVDIAMQITGGVGFDIVVDTTPHTTRPTLDGLEIVRIGGTLVTAGVKTPTMDGFPIGRITTRNITVIGVAGQSNEAYQRAADIVASGALALKRLRTHVFGFDQFDLALDTLLGRVEGEKAINVVVTPTFTADGSTPS